MDMNDTITDLASAAIRFQRDAVYQAFLRHGGSRPAEAQRRSHAFFGIPHVRETSIEGGLSRAA